MDNNENVTTAPAEEVQLQLGSSARRLDPAAIAMGRRKECPFRPGFFVSILPGASYNPRFRKAIQNVRLASAGKTEEEKETRFLSRYEDPVFVVDALVADMEGIVGRSGPVTYTAEIGLKVLSDPANADVLSWISGEAHSYGQFYTEEVQSDKGN